MKSKLKKWAAEIAPLSPNDESLTIHIRSHQIVATNVRVAANRAAQNVLGRNAPLRIPRRKRTRPTRRIPRSADAPYVALPPRLANGHDPHLGKRMSEKTPKTFPTIITNDGRLFHETIEVGVFRQDGFHFVSDLFAMMLLFPPAPKSLLAKLFYADPSHIREKT